MAGGRKAPWFRLFAFDWATDFVQCSLDNSGAGILIRLMVCQWIEGGLPADSEALRRYLRASEEEWARAWSLLEERFPLSLDGLRRNERLEDERRYMEEYLERQSDRGKLGGRPPKKAKRKPEESRGFSGAKPGQSYPATSNQQSADDPPSGDQSDSASPTSPPTNGNGNGHEKPSTRRFWWDPERKRIWGTDEARAALKAKWLERGLTADEFQSQLAACSRWLDDHPTKRTTAANFANRLNNWLNTYLQRVEEREVKQ